jgi:hypothetical protein
VNRPSVVALRVSRARNSEDHRHELEREDERREQQPDVALLGDGNPADRLAADQQHPDPEREEAERQAAADGTKDDPRLVVLPASVRAHRHGVSRPTTAKHAVREAERGYDRCTRGPSEREACLGRIQSPGTTSS